MTAARLLRARGWRDAIKVPQEAVDALAKVDPRIDKATELARFEWLKERQVLTTAVRASGGLGVVDPARLRRLAAQIAVPAASPFAVERVFTRASCRRSRIGRCDAAHLAGARMPVEFIHPENAADGDRLHFTPRLNRSIMKSRPGPCRFPVASAP